jgi:hypothetical protein
MGWKERGREGEGEGEGEGERGRVGERKGWEGERDGNRDGWKEREGERGPNMIDETDWDDLVRVIDIEAEGKEERRGGGREGRRRHSPGSRAHAWHSSCLQSASS